MWPFKKKQIQDAIPRLEDTRPGLEVKWKVGEAFPWKQIWFRVDKVHKDRLELVPTNTTGQFQKRKK